jgi:FMN phosphatase YigB (HAD superfamily)
MTIKAVLFDLDGTLLPLEFNEFIPGYFRALSVNFAELFPLGNLPDLITLSTNAMVNNDGSRSNSDAFWSDFSRRTGMARQTLEPAFARFYQDEFSKLGDGVGNWPEAADVVNNIRSAGQATVLATNPVFPRMAIEHRLGWAKLAPTLFDLITDYENMRFAKPNPGYYSQIAGDIGVDAGDCLMVGNDVRLDLAPARAAGMKTYLVANEYSVGEDGFTADYSGPLGDVPLILR